VSARVQARWRTTWLRGRLVTELGFDPRDPLGLRADAPMLAAWLDFTRQAEAGELLPMSVPGHKQRQDLVGAVIAGDAPFYGGLDTIKHADSLRVES
jgi:arginine decarboxylase